MRKQIAFLPLLLCLSALAQQKDALYDEAKVPGYTLPAVLTLRNGQPVRDAKAWNARRRPEILALYESEVYGKAAAKPPKLNYEVKSVEKSALDGKAVRKLVTVFLGQKSGEPKMDLLLYLPAGADKPVPVILGLSFAGIHTVANDPGVPLAGQWVRDVRQTALEKTRGASAAQWQVDRILAAGYGLATI